MHKAFKFRIYPTTEQSYRINKFIGCTRFVYNYFLDKAKDGNYTSYTTNSKLLTETQAVLSMA